MNINVEYHAYISNLFKPLLAMISANLKMKLLTQNIIVSTLKYQCDNIE